MAKLGTANCPGCGRSLESPEHVPNQKGYAQTVTSYERCLRRCETCGIGLSNARTNPTAIYLEPGNNVPAEIRDGIYETLARSINERNRANKRVKFGFSTSEDAVTWTVFRFLRDAELLKATFGVLFGEKRVASMDKPTLLLWGVPVPFDDSEGERVLSDLIRISDELGESPRARSEPDVILDFGAAGLIVIEVKYRSGNDRKMGDYQHLSRYLEGNNVFANPALIRETGLYELARNWHIGKELAGPHPFFLINLGPETLFRKEGKRLENFRQGLAEDHHAAFLQMTWPYFLSAIPQPRPLWFDEYLMERELWM